MTQVKTFPKIQDFKLNKHNGNEIYKIVEEYKNIVSNNPMLLNEPFFVITNIQYSSLTLDQYPQHIRDNPLFLHAYFSNKEAHPKEFSSITPDLLNNPIFINSAIVKNPDIYLLADRNAVSDYTMGIIEHYHPGKVLKYSASEDLANFEYCVKHVKINSNNFAYLPDEFKNNHTIIETVFNTKASAREQPLVKFLTKEQKKDKNLIETLTIKYNVGCFPFLPKSYHNDPEFCGKVLAKKSIYFKHVSNELKNNQEWVNTLLDNVEYNNDMEQHAFKKYDILSQLPLYYFTEEFCNEHSEAFNIGFTSLSKEQAALPLVIKHAFRADSVYNNLRSSTELDFLNHIPNTGLKQSMKELLKSYKQIYYYEFYYSDNEKAQRSFAREAENLASNYFLFERLQNNLPDKDNGEVKKKKI